MSIFTKRLPAAVVAAATLLSSVIPSAAMPLSPAAPTKSQSDIIRVQGVSESGDNQSPLWWRNQISPGGAPGGYDVRAQDLPGNPGPGPVYQPRDDVRRDDWRQRRDWEERRDAERRDLERRDWDRRREWDRQRDYERRNDYGFYRGHRGYRDYRPGYRQHDGYWFPLAAFAAGAVIGGAISTPVAPRVAGNVNPKHYQWCSARYRSYDVRSNTFQPNNGPRKQCLSPYY